jgi:hypothetical protein
LILSPKLTGNGRQFNSLITMREGSFESFVPQADRQQSAAQLPHNNGGGSIESGGPHPRSATPNPFVLVHEGADDVVSVASNITDFKPVRRSAVPIQTLPG